MLGIGVFLRVSRKLLLFNNPLVIEELMIM